MHVILICIWQATAHKVHIFRFPWVDFIYRFDCSCIFIFSVEIRTNMGWKSRQTDIDLGWNQRGTPVFTRWKILKMASPWYLKELSTFVQCWRKKSMTFLDRIENSTIKLYYVLHRIFLLNLFFFFIEFIYKIYLLRSS